MTGEELFLNELNFHIRQGVSKKDLTDLIDERIKQLTIPVVVVSDCLGVKVDKSKAKHKVNIRDTVFRKGSSLNNN